jgi:hypothetical protein
MGLLTDLHHEGATICMVTHDARFGPEADGLTRKNAIQ